MLNYFRHHSLHKIMWLIVLSGSLLVQTQSLFACNITGNGPQTTCCCEQDTSNSCPMGADRTGGCEISDSDLTVGCCDVSSDITVGLDNITGTDTHHYKQLLTLDTQQSPFEHSSITHLAIPLADTFNTSLFYSSSLTIPLQGTHTYLVTNRFRI